VCVCVCVRACVSARVRVLESEGGREGGRERESTSFLTLRSLASRLFSADAVLVKSYAPDLGLLCVYVCVMYTQALSHTERDTHTTQTQTYTRTPLGICGTEAPLKAFHLRLRKQHGLFDFLDGSCVVCESKYRG